MKYYVIIDYDNSSCSYEFEGTLEEAIENVEGMLEYVIEDDECSLDELPSGSFSIYELPRGVDSDAVYSAGWTQESNGNYSFFT